MTLISKPVKFKGIKTAKVFKATNINKEENNPGPILDSKLKETDRLTNHNVITEVREIKTLPTATP